MALKELKNLIINKSLYDRKCKYFTKKYASMNAPEQIFTDDWDFSYKE